MKDKETPVSGGLRTSEEDQEASLNKEWFDKNPSSWESKLENFPKYVRRQNLTRFIALYEIFKEVIEIKGSVIECGVNQGFGLMTWSKLSAIIEPVNLTRRIYGFDTFEGFPEISDKDISASSKHVKKGDLSANTFEELEALASINDSTRFLGHIERCRVLLHLVDACDNDPLNSWKIVRKEIIKNKILTKEQLEKINNEIISEIKVAADYALDSSYPENSDLFTNVYI